MSHTLRDNLLVTAGARAAYMDAAGHIDLPGGSAGEDVLAEFVAESVDNYIAALKSGDSIADWGFDHFIETTLINTFGIDKEVQ